MNPSSLSARTSRSQPEESPFYVSREIGRHLEVAGNENPSIPDLHTPRPLETELRDQIERLRLALSQMLAHETGQNIQVFRSPAVDNARLCAIADNIWNLRRWSD
ncbi:MAG TPA: hypothetical protein VIM61_11945 [Chthoniobacterales bacterium]|jgi:hypothetical protein